MPGIGVKADAAIRREAADWSALVHDEGAAFDRAAFERWRAADPRHAEAFASVERSWQQAELLSRTNFGRTRNLPERRSLIRLPQAYYAFAVAAVVVVGVVGLLLAGPGVRHQLSAPAATELASRVGQIRVLTLDDGSTVTLDTDSSLRVAFSSSERLVVLSRGRARFDVAHDPKRLFVVAAGGGSVIAHGTLFDVSIAKGRIKVTLLRGNVEVRNSAAPSVAAAPAASETLRPNQTISFVAAAPLPAPGPAPDAGRQWTSGMLTFDDTRLADAIVDANRYNIDKIVLADPALRDRRITGTYHATDIAGFAQSVATSLGLRVVHARGNYVLSSSDALPAG